MTNYALLGYPIYPTGAIDEHEGREMGLQLIFPTLIDKGKLFVERPIVGAQIYQAIAAEVKRKTGFVLDLIEKDKGLKFWTVSRQKDIGQN